MSIAVRCPDNTCRRLVRVSSSLRGKRIQCPACGAGLRIPPAAKAQPVPIDLDDTPPDMEAITEAAPPKPPTGRRREAVDRVADGAAGVTSAVSPVLKLVAAFVFFAGLVFLSVKVIFPALWSDKSLASATIGESTRLEDEARQAEQERLARERPLDDQRQQDVRAAIESGDLARASKLVTDITNDDTVSRADKRSIADELGVAQRRRVKAVYEDAEALTEDGRWDDARTAIAQLETLGPQEIDRPRHVDKKRAIDQSEAISKKEASERAAAAFRFDEALELAKEALKLDKHNKDIRNWDMELGIAMQSGVRIDTHGVSADVYLDRKHLGNTDRTVWRLEPAKRIWLRLEAPGHVPQEVRTSLKARGANEIEVRLVPAVPDAIWVATLLRNGPARWLAARAVGGEASEVQPFIERLAAAHGTKTAKPKLRTVWQVRLASGEDHRALEYSELGTTVRFVDLDDRKTILTSADQVARKRQLDDDASADLWLSAVRVNAGKATGACAKLEALAEFLLVYPERIDGLLEVCEAEVSAAAARLRTAVDCNRLDKAPTRGTMAVGDRIDAEIEAWKRAGLDPPDGLLEQSKTRRP